ncbi:MAG: hypothetical protein ACOYJZ_01045 [Acutalibacter sp.]
MEHFKLIITIVDRGKGVRAVDLYRKHHLHFDFACLGAGTASSRILNFFGLDETAKELVWTLSPESRIPSLLPEARRVLDLDTPGKGILFTIPISGLSAQIPPVLIKPEYAKEDTTMPEAKSTGRPYQLVMAIVNRGCSEQVMEAARSAGAKGGTVINARRVGYEDVQNVLGFTLQPEKEIVAILLKKEYKLPVMQAINREAGLKTACQGVLFSLPVDDIMGLPEKALEGGEAPELS